MNQTEWERLQKAVRRENEKPEIALLVDSPWIPGYCGHGIIDFMARQDVWLRDYQKIKADFAEAIFIPDYWVEFGMATEPSSFGCRIEFFQDNLPIAHHLFDSIDDFDPAVLKLPNPKTSGLAPIALNIQKDVQEKIQGSGDQTYIVATRGPLTLASHLMELSELLIGVKIEPEKVHALLRVTSDYCIRWLEAQLENVKSAKGVLVLDDVTGFLGESDYLEFAHPYLKKIFNAFPEMLHLFHNDTDSDVCFSHLCELGVDIFNFTHKKNISHARARVGKDISLMGNIPPMALARETPDVVNRLTKEMIADYCAANDGSCAGLLVSPGGGVPMGATRDNIAAMIETVRAF
jgi:uroporphyrinogen decarboxylase